MGSLQPENDAKQELNDSGCVQDASVTDSYKGQAQLLDLSDDVLLCILRLCTPRDLKALGHTCPRLGELVCDRTLWTRVDARSSYTGPERLRWYLDNCLSYNTKELQLTGYVNKDARCLGIQDLTWSGSAGHVTPVRTTAANGVDVEHFLLRMWYPHLPRYAVSPRWPDKREQAGKAYSKCPKTNPTQPLSPLSQLASEIVEDVAGPSRRRPNPEDSKKKLDEIVAECYGPQFTLNQNLLKSLRMRCKNLTTLVLEYCNLDYKNTNIRFFPPTLKKLSLKGTRCYNLPLNTSYLGKVQDRLPNLEHLDVSKCEWFEPASLMPLSKVPNLEVLIMQDCRRLTECVAYAALATRYGFHKLKILDMRGSPVADSEVSAFGWLPLLEELYISPPKDFTPSTEHSHHWEDVFAPFVELDPWETEAPDYFKCRSPQPAIMEEDEEKEDKEDSEAMLGNFINCERRIIVIHPNRPNEVIRPRNVQRVDLQPGPRGERAGPEPCCRLRPRERPEDQSSDEEPAKSPKHNDNSPAIQKPSVEPQEPQPKSKEPQPKSQEPQPGPSKRMNPDTGLDLVKRARIDKQTNTDNDDLFKSSSQKDKPKNDVDDPKPRKKPQYIRITRNNPSTSESQNGPFDTDDGINSLALEIHNRYVQEELARLTPEQPLASVSVNIRPMAFGLPVPHPDPNDVRGLAPMEEQDQVMEGDQIMEEVQEERPPQGDGEVRDEPRPINASMWDRPDRHVRRRYYPAVIREQAQGQGQGQPQGQGEGHRLMHIDVDIQRQNFPMNVQHPVLPQYGYHLVSDSAVLRFGRADNDNINYVHIGHNFHANDPGVRPDRSNLRVLSVNGYRNITDRSLEHLATAAPHLRRIDFNNTSVTENGVEVFKAMRPNCEVLFSPCDEKC